MPAEPGKGSRSQKASLATPEAYPIPPPQPPPAAYTVDLGSIQKELGKLTEAVETLKEKSKEQAAKLDAVCLDVHAAKAISRTLMWIIGLVGTLLGMFLAAFFRQLFSGNAH